MRFIHSFLFDRILALYPRAFRTYLGEEMREVFLLALEDPSRSAIRTWSRELLLLPLSLSEAWSLRWGHRIGRRFRGAIESPIVRLALAAALAVAVLGIAIGAAHLVADFGLFHYSTIALVAVALMCGGLMLGLASRIPNPAQAIALASAALLAVIALSAGTFAVDRLLLFTALSGDSSSVVLPGLALDFKTSPHTFIDRTAADGYRRLHIRTYGADVRKMLVVRSTSSDWIWTTIALTVMLASAGAGRQLGRWRIA